MLPGKTNKIGKMPKVYVTYGGLVSPLGNNLPENIASINAGRSGIRMVPNAGYELETLPLAKIEQLEGARYDALLTTALNELLVTHPNLNQGKTQVILSSTKGNMDDVDSDTFASSRKLIQKTLPNAPITIVSNACISGVLAINLAADILRAGDAENVVVIGIDAISDFVNYGFKSLYALSDRPCKPFDATRNGTSLGEACGILVVTTKAPTTFAVEYLAGSASNDANHISGPSRTGEGLFRSVNKTLDRAGIKSTQIDFISAHGTATVFNDEMESIAFGRLQLDHVPVHSLKGYFGHTLGAAGVIETMMLIHSMEQNVLIPSYGFEETGTSVPLAMVQTFEPKPLKHVLKTASGFGGGNASLILKSLEL
jgi:3-oxoacyl-[acyl-carrier-protein] synthase-1